jgi:hypothetical protein
MAGVLFLAVGMSVPEAWWPHTGQAFATDASAEGRTDPCALIIGPARDYCERENDTAAGQAAALSATHPDGSGAGWGLAAAGSGLATLVVWRRWSTLGQRRR